jgi:hypothetical protein
MSGAAASFGNVERLPHVFRDLNLAGVLTLPVSDRQDGRWMSWRRPPCPCGIWQWRYADIKTNNGRHVRGALGQALTASIEAGGGGFLSIDSHKG